MNKRLRTDDKGKAEILSCKIEVLKIIGNIISIVSEAQDRKTAQAIFEELENSSMDTESEVYRTIKAKFLKE